MSLLGFGQPQTGIFQMAYVVEDIDASMRRWVEQLDVGPWFLLEHFTGERGTYRGAPAEADVALAMAFAGHMLVELIAPNDDKPSVYREAIERRGYGFHHFGVGTLDYDGELARHLEQGHELAFQAWVPTGGRVGYVDTTAELPGYLELIEMDEATDTAFTRFYAESLGWDGSDPIRPFA
jgi:Glyoxalase/Bleomycin resistance protein/Dioxygenase superfamily